MVQRARERCRARVRVSERCSLLAGKRLVCDALTLSAAWARSRVRGKPRCSVLSGQPGRFHLPDRARYWLIAAGLKRTGGPCLLAVVWPRVPAQKRLAWPWLSPGVCMQKQGARMHVQLFLRGAFITDR